MHCSSCILICINFSLFLYIYTSISIASISFTGRMKFIPRWTPLALSPRKGTENTYDVRNSRYFLWADLSVCSSTPPTPQQQHLHHHWHHYHHGSLPRLHHFAAVPSMHYGVPVMVSVGLLPSQVLAYCLVKFWLPAKSSFGLLPSQVLASCQVRCWLTAKSGFGLLSSFGLLFLV